MENISSLSKGLAYSMLILSVTDLFLINLNYEQDRKMQMHVVAHVCKENCLLIKSSLAADIL